MDELTALIYNFNTDCYKQYTNVSTYLGNRLDDVLKKIERFYYSEFWEDRYIQKLKEFLIRFDHIQLAKILGTTSELKDNTKFKLFNEDLNSNGVSNNGNMIALNINMNDEKLNDSHIENVIMHEFGHRLYNQPEFKQIVQINKVIINNPNLYIRSDLSNKDILYFTNHNELRLRIIPIIKEMWINNWAAEEAYELSENLRIDDIKDIFTKEYIIDLLENIL